MSSSRLALANRLALVLFAVFAFSAIAVSTAQAENRPTRASLWKVEGRVLSSNETREITARIPSGGESIELKGAGGTGRTVTCKAAKLAPGSFIANFAAGSASAIAYGEVAAELSNCEVTGNGTGCVVKEPIVTKKIIFSFALNTVGLEIGTKILPFFQPRVGTEFFEIKFEGGSCRFSNTQVSEQAYAGLWTDSEPKAEVELQNLSNSEPLSYIIKFTVTPETAWIWATSLLRYEAIRPEKLKAFAEVITPKGELLILIARNGMSTSEKFGLTT